MKIITNSPEESFELGKKVAEKIKLPMSILIEGPLGSGKTTFIRGILFYFGYDIIRSPSFLYVYEYPIPDGKIYHIDLFRTHIDDIEKKLDLLSLLEEKALFLVEWFSKAKEVKFPAPRFVKIRIINENKREFEGDIFNSLE